MSNIETKLENIISNFSPFNKTDILLFKVNLGVNKNRNIYLQNKMLPINYGLIREYIGLYQNNTQKKEDITFISRKIKIKTMEVVEDWIKKNENRRDLIPYKKKTYLSYKKILPIDGLFCTDYDFSLDAREKFDMGQKNISYRIFPVDYRNSIHMFDRNFRNYAFRKLSLNKKFNSEFIILEIDIKSCYFSIVHSIFSHFSDIYSSHIKKGTLWEYLLDEINGNNNSNKHIIKKKQLKAFIYSLLFGAGQNGIKNALLDSIIIDRSILKQKELVPLLKECEDLYLVLKNSSVCIEMEEIRKHFNLLKKSQTIISGPMGTNYNLSSFNNINRAFSLLIQEYETSIMSSTFMLLKKDPYGLLNPPFSNIIFSSHYHDGLILFIEKNHRENIQRTILFYFKLSVKQIGLNHNLMDLDFHYIS